MAKEIDLASLLDFAPEEGRIQLKGYRMVMLSAAALGCLRRELIATLGCARARAVMKRFGHAAGLADADALAKRFPTASRDQQMGFGAALHALEGAALMVRDEARSEVDLEHGRYRVEAYWENSFEAEQHLALIGISDEPVCWTLVGYATGHSSFVAGRPIVVVETECKAMGAERCKFKVGFADEMPEAAARENPDYAPHHLPTFLDELLGTIKKQEKRLRSREREISHLQSELSSRRDNELLGNSKGIRHALDLVELVAPVDTTVLVLGESGTGKELLARAIHERSARAQKPFIAVNCSALPESLQEAELFGFKKGAFTGAFNDSRGLFEAAHRGTLFLDEIGDLSLTAQTKILRALQEGSIKRIGETQDRSVDVRIVGATHRDLAAMVAERSFRDDLYYRLAVFTIQLPPLRERGDDVLLLARRFLARYAKKFGKPMRDLSAAARCALAAYSWPGNVRELENAIQRAILMAQGNEIELEHLPPAVLDGARKQPVERSKKPATAASAQTLHEIADEHARLRHALELSHGNRARAASMLGLSRTTLWRRLKALEL